MITAEVLDGSIVWLYNGWTVNGPIPQEWWSQVNWEGLSCNGRWHLPV